MRRLHRFGWLLCGLLLLARGLPAHESTLSAENALVVSAHPLASEVGLQILQEGGNAVDAAIAVHMALAVVYPRAGNLGGGGFLLYRDADGNVFALDFRERAPAAASRDMYLDEDGEVVEGASTRGPLSAGVPGSVAGMARAHAEWGSLDWDDLIRPAYDLARRGFPVDEVLARDVERYWKDFVAQPYAAELFFPDAVPLKKGSTFRQKDLADTLRHILRDPREFYTGDTARRIVEQSRRGGGCLSMQDLAEYRPVLRKPVRFPYRDLTVFSMSPPSSGGLAMAQILKVLEAFDLGSAGPLSAQAVHWIVEAERQAFADRSRWLGDPDHVEVPAAELLSESYVRSLQRAVRRQQGRARGSRDVPPLELILAESEETTHFSIVDSEGGAVAVTTTINAAYGSRTMVEGAGFFLNNEMDDFSTKPGEPNMYGLVGGSFNAISPGKRPLSSMSPTIVERDGRLWAVVGTPGGPTIITTVAQVLIGLRDFHLDPERVVSLPRFHHQWLPDRIDMESMAFSPDTARLLRERGYTLHVRGDIGDVQLIHVQEDGRMVGVSDPRGIGEPRGY